MNENKMWVEFEAFWNAPEQEELRMSCAKGWAFEVWQASRANDKQGEPVSAQVRYRRPEKGLPSWSAWQPAEVDETKPTYHFDEQGWEVEYRLLYTAPQPTKQQPLPCQECGGDGAGGEHEEDCAMAQPAACVGCEGSPAPENSPCAVCGQQSATGVSALVEALEEISDPIRFMQERLEEGERLNGRAAVQLAEDASYLRGIAIATLAAHHKGGES